MEQFFLKDLFFSHFFLSIFFSFFSSKSAYSPLNFAAKQGNIEIVLMLVDKGALVQCPAKVKILQNFAKNLFLLTCFFCLFFLGWRNSSS